MKRTRCPKCKSENIVYEDYLGVECLLCLACGYDEAEQLDIYPEQKTSQKAKGQHSPYKTGGGKRVVSKRKQREKCVI